MIVFSIFGDMGSGFVSQYKVAESLMKNINKNKVTFVCGLGDNIYPSGCYSKDDKQFKIKFEEPYKKIPNKIKFYMCLGNHDSGNYIHRLFGDRSKNQIEYGIESQEQDKKWYLPGHYYTFNKKHGDVKIDFFVIDTNLDFISNELKDEQMKYMVKALKSSDADWKILYGHHTWISIAGHGNADSVLDKYIRKLIKLGIDMYMNGHDHNKQIIETNIGNRVVTVITCGTGGKVYDDELNLDDIDKKSKLVWHKETLGFGTFFCTKKKLRLEMFDEENKLETTYVIHKNKSNI